jgi:hypothetical protein
MNRKLDLACLVDVTKHLNDLNMKVLWNREFSNISVLQYETLLDKTSTVGKANKK